MEAVKIYPKITLSFIVSAVNLAQGMVTEQSGEFVASRSGSDKAVDGSAHHRYNTLSCAITSGTNADEWWRVDLGADYLIERVGIVTKSKSWLSGIRSN